MAQTDYILRIIEQSAAFLWAIVFNKKVQNYDFALEKIEEAYNGLLNTDGNKIRSFSVNEIIKSNTYKNILDKDNVEIIAHLLYEEADIIEQINGLNKISQGYYQKSFILFYTLDKEIKTEKYIDKINEIIGKLETYEINNETKYKMYEYYRDKDLYGKAEDTLYELMEKKHKKIKEEIGKFYKKLLDKDDETLEKGNLPRNEIIEGIENMRK